MAGVWEFTTDTVLPKIKQTLNRNPLVWALGLTVLFTLILWGVANFTDASVIDSARAVQAIGILVAICVGGILAYQRLHIFRTFEPHLTISQKVSHRNIGDSYVHIDITATLHNSSKVQVEILKGFFQLQQIAPETDENIEELYAQVFIDKEYNSIGWETLEKFERRWSQGELVVEPGESHPETQEFIVSKDVKSVMIYSYFYNQRYSEQSASAEGWAASTVYDIT